MYTIHAYVSLYKHNKNLPYKPNEKILNKQNVPVADLCQGAVENTTML